LPLLKLASPLSQKQLTLLLINELFNHFFSFLVNLIKSIYGFEIILFFVSQLGSNFFLGLKLNALSQATTEDGITDETLFIAR